MTALKLARVAVVATAVALVFVGSAGADQFEDAMAAYKRGDYEAAGQLLGPLAEGGDRRAQFILGYMYLRGQGVVQDDTKAANWTRKAAAQGVAPAQDNLGH